MPGVGQETGNATPHERDGEQIIQQDLERIIWRSRRLDRVSIRHTSSSTCKSSDMPDWQPRRKNEVCHNSHTQCYSPDDGSVSAPTKPYH